MPVADTALLEQGQDWNQTQVNGVDTQTKTFQGHGTQQRPGIFRGKHDKCDGLVTIRPESSMAYRILDGPFVCQPEGAHPLGCDSQLGEDTPR